MEDKKILCFVLIYIFSSFLSDDNSLVHVVTATDLIFLLWMFLDHGYNSSGTSFFTMLSTCVSRNVH